MRTNDEIVNLITSIRKEKNISISELGRRVNMPKSTLSRYLNKSRQFPLDRVSDFARVLNVSSEYILGVFPTDITSIYNQLDENRKAKVYSFAELQLEEQNKIIEFPKKINVLGQTAAGSPVDYGDSDIEEKEFKTVPKGAQYALNVKGDSMTPLIPDGSIVFYKEQQNVENGEIAIVEVDGDGVTCKKVCFNYENNKIILRSLNDKYEDVELNGNQVRIIGKVVL